MVKTVDADVQLLIDRLGQDAHVLLEEFAFTENGQRLSEQEALRFITFLKEESTKKSIH
ncbi:hypothetical protein [Paenibacillus ferrarius]|uniref:hypothetical protein n=1 Tax=Paenibacillus ferrarius TaxID=1469647 RepID=UPI003D2BBB1F